MESLYEIVANRSPGAQSTDEGESSQISPAAPSPLPSAQISSLQSIGMSVAAGAASHGEGKAQGATRGKMLTGLLKRKLHKARDVKVALEAFHVHEMEGDTVPASKEGTLEAAVKLVGEDAQVAVLQVCIAFLPLLHRATRCPFSLV